MGLKNVSTEWNSRKSLINSTIYQCFLQFSPSMAFLKICYVMGLPEFDKSIFLRNQLILTDMNWVKVTPNACTQKSINIVVHTQNPPPQLATILHTTSNDNFSIKTRGKMNIFPFHSFLVFPSFLIINFIGKTITFLPFLKCFPNCSPNSRI